METQDIGQECPICGKTKAWKKPLYGHPVCEGCYYAFAYRRQFAFAIDIIVLYFCLLLIQSIGLPYYLSASLVFLLSLGFFLKDGFLGYSLGKAMMGVQVIDTSTGRPCDFMASLKRNLPLVIPLMPFYVFSQLCKGQRIGDGWSSTGVIWKKYADKVPFVLE